MHVEHLSYLEPVAEWARAEVLEAPDGAFELFAEADELIARESDPHDVGVPNIEAWYDDEVGDPDSITLGIEPKDSSPKCSRSWSRHAP